MDTDQKLITSLRACISVLNQADLLQRDLKPLIESVGDARFVLLGEASHGTHEFYEARAEITKMLIQEKGFTTVAIEGDWPDAYSVNRYVQSQEPKNARTALAGFERFPSWMWRNTEVLRFITWLHAHNSQLSSVDRVGFYGLDLYSMHRSMQAVIDYLDKVNPNAAEQARERYACIDTYAREPQEYGYFAALNAAYACQEEVTQQLMELRYRAFERIKNGGFVGNDELFCAQQNALVVKNAENYYRSLFGGGDAHSWNVRDRHMMETLEALINHRENKGKAAKIIVWAHNTHIGDARATQMSRAGELNLGQLVREAYDKESFLIGFTTYTGTVSAACQWGRPVERKHVRPALKGSYEELFHALGIPNFFLLMRNNPDVAKMMAKERLERAIGVIYKPQTERQSHYFNARLADQFDAVMHFDKTKAIEPLDLTSLWQEGEFPETFPFGQ